MKWVEKGDPSQEQVRQLSLSTLSWSLGNLEGTELHFSRFRSQFVLVQAFLVDSPVVESREGAHPSLCDASFVWTPISLTGKSPWCFSSLLRIHLLVTFGFWGYCSRRPERTNLSCKDRAYLGSLSVRISFYPSNRRIKSLQQECVGRGCLHHYESRKRAGGIFHL